MKAQTYSGRQCPSVPRVLKGTGSLVLHFRRTRLLAVAKTAKPATSKGKFAAKAAKKEPKAAAKGTATPKSQAVKTEPTEAVGKIGMERGQLSGLLTSLSYQCKAKKATPEHRAAAAKILSDYKAADVSGKSKILEKLVQSGMHCLDWANELTKNTEVQHEEANEFVKGFMTRWLGCSNISFCWVWVGALTDLVAEVQNPGAQWPERKQPFRAGGSRHLAGPPERVRGKVQAHQARAAAQEQTPASLLLQDAEGEHRERLCHRHDSAQSDGNHGWWKLGLVDGCLRQWCRFQH